MAQEIYEIERGVQKIKLRLFEMKRKASRPLIIGIAGGSGSGKTSRVAERIKSLFPGSKILPMDDYFRGQKFMDSIKSKNWDEPRAIELERLLKHLKDLRQGKAIEKPIYSFETGEREGYETFEPSEIIIVEGLFALHETIVGELDLKIFVEIAIHGSLIRRIIRDIKRTGQSKEEIFKQFIETVYPMYKIHVEPTRAKADIVIINQYVPEIEAECCESREMQIRAILIRRIPRKKLRSLGFQRIRTGSVKQKDTYYAAPSWKFPYPNELIRIREENERCFLAYKGPLIKGFLRIRPKIEFEVEPLLKDALLLLGYKKKLVLIKKRELFLGEGVELALDETERDGYFIEFRTADLASESKIMRYFRELGIPKKSITKKPFIQLILEARKAQKGVSEK
jgi:uridine kinase